MLLGNFNVFNKNPGHQIGGVTDPVAWFKGGSLNMFYYGDSAVAGQTEKAAFNVGYLPPYSWVLAPKSGGLSSHRNTTITIVPTGALAGGLPGTGSSTITFTGTATGGLIVSGSGTATITFSQSGTLISVAAGSGSATITFTATGAAGALAGLSGQSTVTLSPAATIYAIGYLAGIATNENEFSPDALARAVWDAIAINYNNPGSMGEAIQAALAAAGDPWGTALPGSYADGTAGKIVGQKLLTLSKFLALK